MTNYQNDIMELLQGDTPKQKYDNLKTILSNRMSISYGWKVANGGNWTNQYPLINEDENDFKSREDAISWLLLQKKNNPSLGSSECFLLQEMFFI